MKNKVVLVFLAMVLVMSLAAFGACAAPAKRAVTEVEAGTPTLTISPLTATRMVGETLELEVIVTREGGSRGVGEPVGDIDIMLEQIPGDIPHQGETDESGEYVFEIVGTEAGTFAYTVTAPGYPNLTARAAVTWVEAGILTLTISPESATRMVGETLELEVIVTREGSRGVGEPVKDINCVLFDELPGTVHQGETDANGEYVFEVVGTEAGTFAYTVTAPGYPNLTARAAVTWVEVAGLAEKK